MGMLKKKMNKKGFTLAELLIVVAIIAILVAVSIPIFTSKLEKAKESTDVANMRAAKAEASAAYVGGDFEGEATTATANGWVPNTDKSVYTTFYDVDDGVFVTAEPNGYGKGTVTKGGTVYKGYKEELDYTGKVIKVTVTVDKGTITLDWVAGKSTT